MKKHFFLFNSTQDALKAERVCRQAALAVVVVPIPRELSAECGIALETRPRFLAGVEKTLKQHSIEFRIAEI